ncbi:hypothetical protein Q73_04290 [Bacillus coahuilensis m2-6]|uniref:hypothetical protein n=1 Tax=Bacillus coahuilensis TaxID=408580 RepID=UPI0001850891|nr:hypothetical protein [Bacillus coahuilensis]KUP08879.1 hypothetical protein Q73_04290 [Bacillus coahuilensis m2-6]
MINATGWITFSYIPKAVKNYKHKAKISINKFSKEGNRFEVQTVSQPFERNGDIVVEIKCNFDITFNERSYQKEASDYISIVSDELQELLPVKGAPITQIVNIQKV